MRSVLTLLPVVALVPVPANAFDKLNLPNVSFGHLAPLQIPENATEDGQIYYPGKLYCNNLFKEVDAKVESM
jgi:hypothetical protein